MSSKQMREHHRRALQAWVAEVSGLPHVRGGVLVGSLARGTARADSDVDVYLVVSNDAFAEALAAGEVAHVRRCEDIYPNGYVDVKLVCDDLLDRAAAEADDPFRASLRGAQVLWDADGSLPGRIEQILDPDAVSWPDRVTGFLAQAWLHGGYFLPGALDRDDPFAAQWANGHLCFAAARALLASRQVLCAGPKYVTSTLMTLALPAGVLEAWRTACGHTSVANARHLLDVLSAELGALTVDERLSRFIIDNELAWYRRRVPPEYT